MTCKHTKLHETINVDNKVYCLDCHMLNSLEKINKAKVSLEYAHILFHPELYSENHRRIITVLYKQAV